MGSVVKILGTGCMKCKTLTENTRQAMKNLGMEGEVEMVTNVNDIVSFGVAVTPALVIDDNVWSSGEVPSVEKIQEYLSKQNDLNHNVSGS